MLQGLFILHEVLMSNIYDIDINLGARYSWWKHKEFFLKERDMFNIQ